MASSLDHATSATESVAEASTAVGAAAGLPAFTAEVLVQLRALLEAALSDGRSAAPMSRLRAMILLDGVNERALYLAAEAEGVLFDEKTKFEDLASRLKQALGSRWTMAGWQEVRRLHRMRNLGQHEGEPPAAERLPAWATATEEFAADLIRTVFKVDLAELVLAAAVEHAGIRERLVTAERALLINDSAAAFENAGQAFDTAIEAWRRLREAGRRTSWAETPRPDSFVKRDDIEAITRHIDQLREAEPFVTDAGEYTWFRKLRREYIQDKVPPTLDEARRVLTFVFWWIIRWQSAASLLDANRTKAHHQSRRVVRTSPATSARVTAVQLVRSPRNWELQFQLVDVPPVETFDAWHAALWQRLGHLASGEYAVDWRVDEDSSIHAFVYRYGPPRQISPTGTARNALPLSEFPPQLPEALAQQLNEALRGVEDDVRRQIEEQSQREADAQGLERALMVDIEQAGGLPDWVVKTELALEHWQGDGVQLALRVSEPVADEIAAYLQKQVGIEAYYATHSSEGGHPAVILQLTDGHALSTVCQTADAHVRELIDRHHQQETTAEAAAAVMRTRLITLLLPPDE